MLEWTSTNRIDAGNEGWWFGVAGSRKYKLGFLSSRFLNHTDLGRHLIERAATGSPLHVKALALIYANDRVGFLGVMRSVPANKTGALVQTIITMARMAGAITGEP